MRLVDGARLQPWDAEFTERVVAPIHKHFLPTDEVLDLGCGDSTALGEAYLLRHVRSVVGGDIRPSPTWSRLRSARHQFVRNDAVRLPFRDRAFDVVLLKDVLHFLDVDQAIAEMRRVARRKVIVLCANRRNPAIWLHKDHISPTGADHLTRGAFQERVRRAAGGWSVEFATREGHVLATRRAAARKAFYLLEDAYERLLPAAVHSYLYATLTRPGGQDRA